MSAVRFIHHGLFPGTDPARYVQDQLDYLEHAPLTLGTQPERGPGSDMAARSLAWMRGLPVDLQPYGWRLSRAAGIDQRRIDSALHTDLAAFGDVLSAANVEQVGKLKLQSYGPLTLAAVIHLPSGEKVVSDQGALAELAIEQAHTSAEGLRHLADEYGIAHFHYEVFEHQVANILAGTVPTASGFERYRAVEPTLVQHYWEQFNNQLQQAANDGQFTVHLSLTLAPSAQWSSRRTMMRPQATTRGWRFDETTQNRFAELVALAASCGFAGLYVPDGLAAQDWEHLAGWVEADRRLLLGAEIGGGAPTPSRLAEQLTMRWREQGLPAGRLKQTDVTALEETQTLEYSAHRQLVEHALNLADALNQLSVDGF